VHYAAATRGQYLEYEQGLMILLQLECIMNLTSF